MINNFKMLLSNEYLRPYIILLAAYALLSLIKHLKRMRDKKRFLKNLSDKELNHRLNILSDLNEEHLGKPYKKYTFGCPNGSYSVSWSDLYLERKKRLNAKD